MHHMYIAGRQHYKISFDGLIRHFQQKALSTESNIFGKPANLMLLGAESYNMLIQILKYCTVRLATATYSVLVCVCLDW